MEIVHGVIRVQLLFDKVYSAFSFPCRYIILSISLAISMENFVDYYTMLRISSDASEEEIKRAYRDLASRYHPDKDPSEGAAKRFKEINEAYSVLSDKLSRVKYDRIYIEHLASESAQLSAKYYAQTKPTVADMPVRTPEAVPVFSRIPQKAVVLFSLAIMLILLLIVILIARSSAALTKGYNAHLANKPLITASVSPTQVFSQTDTPTVTVTPTPSAVPTPTDTPTPSLTPTPTTCTTACPLPAAIYPNVTITSPHTSISPQDGYTITVENSTMTYTIDEETYTFTYTNPSVNNGQSVEENTTDNATINPSSSNTDTVASTTPTSMQGISGTTVTISIDSLEYNPAATTTPTPTN